MSFTKINVDVTANEKSTMQRTYSMFFNIDLSHLMAFIKDKQLNLFPVCLYGIARTVNHHPEFRMAVDTFGNVGYFDTSSPCYTVFCRQNKAFTDVWTQYNDNFNAFYQNCVDASDKLQNLLCATLPLTRSNTFNVSCVPSTSLYDTQQSFYSRYEYLQPVFTLGKSFDSEDKVLLPMAIQVHGAICDEAHTSSFVNELQEWADTFAI
ncbi:MAG: CatA-like O-acetyltransferase [Oscillospiraceae bacterium]